jgi:CheY-like chemotaxis protein
MSLQGRRILLVEDAPDIREVFTVLLRVEGAEVTATGSGREAIDLADNGDFDVVLSDLGLPDTSGTLIRQIVRARTAVARHRGHGYGEPHLTCAAGWADVFYAGGMLDSEWLDKPDLAASA